MQGLTLHDKFTEEEIGTILLTDKNTADIVRGAWDEFQKHHGSNNEKFGDIYDFVNYFPKLDMEVISLEFYQP